MRRIWPVAILVLCAFGGALWAEEAVQPSCLSNENLRHYRVARTPRLSPDGRRVVFVIQEGAADRGVSHLWWTDVARPDVARQITFSPSTDKSGESDPQWMPDGSAILFAAKRDEHKQIYRLSTAGGEASALKIEAPESEPAAKGSHAEEAGASRADRELDVGRYAISPDGKWIALLASDPETAAEKKKKEDKDDAIVVDHEPHHARAWLYSFADGEVAPIGDGTRVATSVAWSRDSKRVAVITEPPGNSGDLGPKHDVEVVDVASPGSFRVVKGVPPTVEAVSWSPDGDEFALLAQTIHDAPPGIDDLYVIPVAGGTARDLSGTSAVTIAGRLLEWLPDSRGIYVEAQQGTSRGLVRFPVSSGAPETFSVGFPVASSFDTNAEEKSWTFVGEATDRLPDVMFASSLGGAPAPVRLSRANPSWPDEGWVRAKPVEWKSADGLKIAGLFFQPSDTPCAGQSPRAKKIPLIVEVHGGPTGAWVERFSPFTQFLLAQGWAVLEPNPRGSTGYGWQFAAANKNDLGGKDYEDVMAGVDWAIAHEPVDSGRLGLYGYSYGGEMAGFVEGRTTRFAAIVSGAPVIDQYSEYGTEDDSWYDRWFFGQPWRRPADAWRQSPLARASEARTPFLLLQGEADVTDPLGQSQEMYRALRQEGVEVEMVQYPRESHGGLGGGIAGYPSREPWHGFDGRKHIVDWFRTHFEKSAASSTLLPGRSQLL